MNGRGAGRDRLVPPLSPVLFLGMALRHVPLPVYQLPLALAMRAVRRRHGSVFERLGDLGETVFVIDPVDLPFRFLLRASATNPSLRAIAKDEYVDAKASVRGPLKSLIDLLEGRIDGDSLFFSRELVMDGDTEAVVALSNAVEGAEIDVARDLLAPLGPLSGPAARVVARARRTARRIAADLETARGATIAPAMGRAETLAARLEALDQRVSDMERGGKRRGGVRNVKAP
ncbi:MAG: SCP2 sterol-binding domain-containing protein [Rhodospirillales bacterium]|jgi:predicted lipid carrier protein YhbT|nr:SCP2 sterol-binding domain-containing protein [Rhodospirillales bacterium]MDP6804289.1 SCP2 sterol-binding domain-containing protein [Rhodospirillales bacterium]